MQPAAETLAELKASLRRWSEELGFDDMGVADLDLRAHAPKLRAWLAAGNHGEMAYLARNVDKRLQPELLVEGALRAIVVRMNYLPADAPPQAELADGDLAYIARYALGRDYHKVLRKRLAKLAARLTDALAPLPHRYRVFTDSAPVLERALAAKAGLGWVGRHSLLLNRDAGSWFFLGEILTDLPLPVDEPDDADQCGACRACVRVCPTDAILPDRTIDARRCIAYLTIENKGVIPEESRSRIGNRVFGCDDCQIHCPWNRAAPATREPDFTPRRQPGTAELDAMFAWSEAEFLRNTEGTALRRIDYRQWQRNLAVALGNAEPTQARIALLTGRLSDSDPLVAEHIRWALRQLSVKNEDR